MSSSTCDIDVFFHDNPLSVAKSSTTLSRDASICYIGIVFEVLECIMHLDSRFRWTFLGIGGMKLQNMAIQVDCEPSWGTLLAKYKLSSSYRALVYRRTKARKTQLVAANKEDSRLDLCSSGSSS